MSVSIILVSYNTKELTRNCIKSIYEHTKELDYDIWLIDNASSDGSARMVKEEFPEVNLIESQENLGFGRANNVVINKVNSKYVFLLNTDTLLLNNAVKILYDFMERPENHNVGACGGQLFNSDMSLQGSVGEFDTLEKIRKKAIGFNFNKIFYRYKHKVTGNPELSSNNDHDYIVGADLMLRKTALDITGQFDERFFMYGEEAELCYRLKKKGFKIKFYPEAKILHFGGASSYKKNTQIEVEKMILENTILFFKLAYGKETAKKAKFYYILYYLRYLPLRFFSPKAFQRLKIAMQIKL